MRIWSDHREAIATCACVVLTGAGERAFCTGADMKKSGNKTGLEYWAAARPGGFGGIALRETLDVPVIARVNGHALGGGFEMVLGCDIVVAARRRRFGLPEPRVGRLPLDGGMTLLQRQIPHRLGDGHAADRPAHRRPPRRWRFGLVNEVVPRAELDEAVDALGRRHPRLRAAVGAGDQADGAPAARSSRRRRRRRCACRRWSRRCSRPTRTKACKAFVEKRAPAWQGR